MNVSILSVDAAVNRDIQKEKWDQAVSHSSASSLTEDELFKAAV